MGARAAELYSRLEKMPDKKIPELQWLTAEDWLKDGKKADLETELAFARLERLRNSAKHDSEP